MSAQTVNPYEILGVARDADERTIQKAFRGIAFKNHPDQNQDSPGDVARLQQAKEAYDMIRDAGKRAAYDRANPVRRQPTSHEPQHARTEQRADAGSSQPSGSMFDFMKDMSYEEQKAYKKEVFRRHRERQAAAAQTDREPPQEPNDFFRDIHHAQSEAFRIFFAHRGQQAGNPDQEEETQKRTGSGWFHFLFAPHKKKRMEERVNNLKNNLDDFAANASLESVLSALREKDLPPSEVSRLAGVIQAHLRAKPEDLEKAVNGYGKHGSLMDVFKAYPENHQIANLAGFLIKQPHLIAPDHIESLKASVENMVSPVKREALRTIAFRLEYTAQNSSRARVRRASARQTYGHNAGPRS